MIKRNDAATKSPRDFFKKSVKKERKLEIFFAFIQLTKLQIRVIINKNREVKVCKKKILATSL